MTKKDARIFAQALFQAEDYFKQGNFEEFLDEVGQHLSMHDPKFDIDQFVAWGKGEE